MKGIALFFLLTAVLLGVFKKVQVYDAFVQGAKEGIRNAVSIAPALIAMLCAISLLRASGLMDVLSGALAPLLSKLGIPGDVLPVMLMRPLSGSGTMAMVGELMEKYGPDSREAYLGCVLCSSNETLFYVLAVYTGACGVKKTRHVIPCGLLGWLCGSLTAVWLGQMG